MLSGLFGVVAVAVMGVVLGIAGPSGAADGDGSSEASAELIADVVIAVPPTDASADDGTSTTDEVAADIVTALQRSPAIAWVVDDQLGISGRRLLVAFAPGSEVAARRAVDAAIVDQLETGSDADQAFGADTDAEAAAELVAASDFTVSGRDVTDRELLGRVGLGAALAVALSSLVLGVIVAWRLDGTRGVLVGVTLAAAAWLAGEVGESVAGPFDGSLATTALPAALGGIVVAGYLVVRLLVWFEAPHGEDQADVIRRAVQSVGFELFLLVATTGITALFLELLAPTRSVASVLLVGVVTAAVFVLAVLPPALAVIGLPSGSSAEPLPIPSGRDVPILVLVGFAVFLTALGFFAFRSTSDAELLDERALGADDAAVVGTRDLLARGGDPTSAIVVQFPEEMDGAARTAWLERVSRLERVARVDTAAGRFEQGAFTSLDGLIGVPAARGAGGVVADEATAEPEHAIVVPGVTGRSAAAIALVDALEAVDADLDLELHGSPVDGRDAAAGARLLVWSTVMALAVAGAVAVFALIDDLRLAGMAAAIRLVSLAAAAGLYHLLVGDVTGQEIQLALFVLALGAGMFELGFLRRLVNGLAGRRVVDTDALVDSALEIEGTAATVAMALGVVGSFGLLVADLTVMRRFGILLAVVILIETVVAIWLLRPVMLGSRAISHFASKPVKVALEALNGSTVSSQVEHRAWVDVVIGLLEAEFSFQADPAAADIASVFIPETPLFVDSFDHHRNLADAGLRIVGRQPRLRALRVVSNSPPATLVVTVDHPVRQLVDGRNKIVGVRQAERRSVMLWMIMQHDGTYRIADSVELGSTSLASAEQPAPVEPPVPVAVD